MIIHNLNCSQQCDWRGHLMEQQQYGAPFQDRSELLRVLMQITQPMFSAHKVILNQKNQFRFQSIMNIGKNFMFDGIVRYVDVLPRRINGIKVPAYSTFDLRLAWEYKMLTISVVGKNLAEKYHTEFGLKEIPRSVMG